MNTPAIRVVSIALIACAALTTGCANLTPPAQVRAIGSDTAHWMHYDASRRGTFVIPSGQKVVVCAEPSPDVALNLVSKLEASAKAADEAQLAAKAEFNATVVELAKRTQMVMFLRESMYRLCEQTMSGNIPATEVPAMYADIVKAATTLAQAEESEAKAKVQDAQRRLLETQRNLPQR
jgi:hypothetical protein